MKFFPDELQAYVDQHSTPGPALLQELEDYTHAHLSMPQMLSGHLNGRLLSLLSRLHRPRTIVEVGTFTGYSALCLAEGLAQGGILHTLELDAHHAEIATRFMRRSPYAAQIVVHVGPALQTLAALNLSPDLVFLDADKTSYLDYYETLLPAMPPGALLLADNVLWSGKVVDPAAQDPDTVALRQFSQRVRADDRVEVLMLPVRDGVSVIRKR